MTTMLTKWEIETLGILCRKNRWNYINIDKTDIMNAVMYAESDMRKELKKAKEKFDNNIINELTNKEIIN